LGEDVNAPQVGVDAVGKCDVDDAIDAPKGDSRLGPVASERIEALTRATCEQDPKSVFHPTASEFLSDCVQTLVIPATLEVTLRDCAAHATGKQ
jgi:hypothetical protein